MHWTISNLRRYGREGRRQDFVRVVCDFEEGFIFANGVGSEAALVDGAATSTFGSFSPAYGVSSFEPVESLAEKIRAFGLDE